MLNRLVLVCLIGSWALASRVEANPQEAATAPAATQPAEQSPADKAFEPLRQMMDNLVESLGNNGGVRKEDEGPLRFVRDKAAAFSREFPSDPRGVAIELQISMWLKENDLVADLFNRLATLRPDDDKIPLGAAQYAINHNRFKEAIEALKARTFDPVKTPEAFLALSDALFAEHEFVEAVDALKMIPKEVLDKDVFVKLQVDEKLKQRENYETEFKVEQAIQATETAANDLPQATIKTAKGDITVELFENQAPNTVANFIKLAESGFYNGTKFHRVLANFMAQGGDPNSKEGATGIPGQGDPGYYIPDEVGRTDARKHFAGSLAMAKTTAPNTGGCQFYITATPTVHLNGIHTVFGRVLPPGLDIARSLEQNDLIESIAITRKREHPYEPTTLPLPGAATQPETQLATQPTTLPGSEPVTIEPVTIPPLTPPASTPATQPITP
ncbi:MAG TPA: peptidylprolyl isomerase [Phycisphaerales bacterium]|nr:peptidylprolyl isomerase [Phycisphaerales bacterium]